MTRWRLTVAGVSAAIATAVGTPALSQQATAPEPEAAQTPSPPAATWKAPALTYIRYDEDWSGLADPSARTGRWTEALKYIPLDGEKAYLSTGLEVRFIHDTYRNNGWGAYPAPNDNYFWLRATPHADLHVGVVRVFVQPILAYGPGVTPVPTALDETGADLLQGFAEVDLPIDGGGRLMVRAGRQMMPLGGQRLVSTRYGFNVPLAFDGLRAKLNAGPVAVDVFDVKPVEPGAGDLDDRRSRSRRLRGVYATIPNLDLYYMDFRHRGVRFGTLRGDEHRETYGARSFGRVENWRWNIEGALQTGRLADQRIRAWSFGSEVARSFPTARFAPDAMLRFDIQSGDADPTDRKLGTFNAMFPRIAYYGLLAPAAPANLVSLHPRVILDLGRRVSLDVNGLAYWRQSRADSAYDTPTTILRPPGAATSRFIGKAVEMSLYWQATPELSFSTTASTFFPGGFIRQTGRAGSIGFLDFEANFRF